MSQQTKTITKTALIEINVGCTLGIQNIFCNINSNHNNTNKVSLKNILSTDKVCLIPYHCWDEDNFVPGSLEAHNFVRSPSFNTNEENLAFAIAHLESKYIVNLFSGAKNFGDIFMFAMIKSKEMVVDEDGCTLNDLISVDRIFNGGFYKYDGVWFYGTDS